MPVVGKIKKLAATTCCSLTVRNKFLSSFEVEAINKDNNADFRKTIF